MKTPRILIAAGASGSGKTLITCGLLQALQNRKLHVASFKCGPDYIDPMFHAKVLNRKSYNLDTFFAKGEIIRYLLKSHSEGCEIAVIEGVMGYYDGVAGTSTKASAYDVSRVTDTPTVLLVNGKGMSTSIAAFVKGFATFREDSNIKGVLLNQVSGMTYPRLKEMIEEETGIQVYGYVPKLTDCVLESRHLGLVMPDEIEDIQGKLQKLAETLDETVDIDGLIELGQSASELDGDKNWMDKELYYQKDETHKNKREQDINYNQKNQGILPINIGVARDEAFCFMYEDNLQLLQRLGANLVYFSPLHDKEIPENVDGLLLSGGYPELYAKELSENKSMIASIKKTLDLQMPCIAECGGFMYLHESMETKQGESYHMVGAISGNAYYTGKLSRFGYITLTAEESKVFGEKMGEIPAHEFHYFDSTNCGETFAAKKPMSKRGWKCGIVTDNLVAGFPHFYFYGNLKFPKAFVETCKGYHKIKRITKSDN